MLAERGTRGGLEVWKHIMIPVATLVVAVLVFLFGTDVIGRHGGIGMLGEPDGDSVTTESTDQRGPRLHATYSFKMAPFVHPKIINDLVGSLSDSGDQVVAINLLDSQDTVPRDTEVTHKNDGPIPAHRAGDRVSPDVNTQEICPLLNTQ